MPYILFPSWSRNYVPATPTTSVPSSRMDAEPATLTTSVPSSRMDAEPGSLPQHLLQVYPLQGWMQSPDHSRNTYYKSTLFKDGCRARITPATPTTSVPSSRMDATPTTSVPSSRMDAEPGSLPQHLLQVYPLQGWMQHLLQVYPLQGWMQSPDHSRNTYYKCTLFKDGCRAWITPATPTTSVPSSRMDAEPGSLSTETCS